MNHSTEYFVPSHDPILGIHEKNIASTLTMDNWRRKAIVANFDGSDVYIYIAQGEIRKLNRKIFCVTGYSLKQETVCWRHQFLTPEEAVSWVNRHFIQKTT